MRRGDRTGSSSRAGILRRDRLASIYGLGHALLLVVLLVTALLGFPRADPFGVFFWPFIMLPPPLSLGVALLFWRRSGSPVGVAGADALVICLYVVDFLLLAPAPNDVPLMTAWRTLVGLSVILATLGIVASALLLRPRWRELTPATVIVVIMVAISQALFVMTLLAVMNASLDSCQEGYCGLVIPFLGIPAALTLVVTLVWLLGSRWPLIVFDGLMFALGLSSSWSGANGSAWLATTLVGLLGGVFLVTQSRRANQAASGT